MVSMYEPMQTRILDVVIAATDQANIGRIVIVIALHDGKRPLAMDRHCPV